MIMPFDAVRGVRRKSYEACQRIREALVRLDPANRQWEQDLLLVRDCLESIASVTKSPTDSTDASDVDRDILQALDEFKRRHRLNQ
jgi:hypothetical protein